MLNGFICKFTVSVHSYSGSAIPMAYNNKTNTILKYTNDMGNWISLSNRTNFGNAL
jgi:hypothetical protein